MKSIRETVALPEYCLIIAGIVGLFSIAFYLFADYDRRKTERLAKVRRAYQAERESLIRIFEAMNGEAWFDKTGWLSSLPLSKWKGVKLDPYTKRVNKLILPSNRLAGVLPGEPFLHLSELNEIDMRENDLEGPIPEELCSLQNLEGLYLQENRLSGRIPLILGKLKKLSGVYLYNNSNFDNRTEAIATLKKELKEDSLIYI